MNHNCVYKMNHKGIQEWKLNCCQILNSCQPPKVKDNWGDSQTSSSIKFALNIKWLQTEKLVVWACRGRGCFGSIWKVGIGHTRFCRSLTNAQAGTQFFLTGDHLIKTWPRKRLCWLLTFPSLSASDFCGFALIMSPPPAFMIASSKMQTEGRFRTTERQEKPDPRSRGFPSMVAFPLCSSVFYLFL